MTGAGDITEVFNVEGEEVVTTSNSIFTKSRNILSITQRIEET